VKFKAGAELEGSVNKK